MEKDHPEEMGILAAVCHPLSVKDLWEVVSFLPLISSAGVLIHHFTCSILDYFRKTFCLFLVEKVLLARAHVCLDL